MFPGAPHASSIFSPHSLKYFPSISSPSLVTVYRIETRWCSSPSFSAATLHSAVVTLAPSPVMAVAVLARIPGRSTPLMMIAVCPSVPPSLLRDTSKPPMSEPPSPLSCVERSVSMKRRLTIPSAHPNTTPTHCPASPTFRTSRRPFCAAVRCAAGMRMRRFTNPSTVSPKHRPATSEHICPIHAAVSVESPKVTPSVRSMALPAWIITVLSMKPKPTMGTAQRMAWLRSCAQVGLGTACSAGPPTDAEAFAASPVAVWKARDTPLTAGAPEMRRAARTACMSRVLAPSSPGCCAL
mmetsp:Transcript_55958/g.177295  ORF Transcript_55958/g.177295 Transcript_55958/m.177295 type:complete len:296 (-) Transcript_55958:105-992(-)